METLACPLCGVEMEERRLVRTRVHRCPAGHGVFLARADLGDLIDAENDWHRSADSHHTAPLPRITPDMVAPPAVVRRPPAWVASLFD